MEAAVNEPDDTLLDEELEVIARDRARAVDWRQGKDFLIWWTGAMALGGILAVLIAQELFSIEALDLHLSALLWFVELFTLVGLAQWLVLRRWISRDLRAWVAVSVACGLAGWIFYYAKAAMRQPPTEDVELLLRDMSIGLYVASILWGAGQAAVLVANFRTGGRYFFGNLIGFFLSNAAGKVAGGGEHWFLSALISWLVWGGITGFSLRILLQDQFEKRSRS
jgi:hypothetical protein